MGRPPILMTVRGVTKPLQQWAAENGLNLNTLRKRLRRGLSPEEAIATPTQNRTRLITIEGDTRPLAEWLLHYDRHDVTFYRRIARGYSEQDAITTPLRGTALPRADKYDKPLKGRAGVYMIRCIPTKRYYIGSSVDLLNAKGRWSSALKARKKRSLRKRMLPDLEKHGAASFEFSVLEFCAPSRVQTTKSALLRRAEKKHPRRLYNPSKLTVRR
jgi:hypothetical protein